MYNFPITLKKTESPDQSLALTLRGIVFFVMVAVVLLATQASYAQSVKIRSGIHEDYTRLVFDWSSQGVKHEVIKKSASQTEILFNKNANTIDTSALNIQKSAHVNDVEVTSKAPLRATINHHGSANLRVFTILNRVVVDVKATGIKNDLSQASKQEETPKKTFSAQQEKKLEQARKKAKANKIDLQVGNNDAVKRVDEAPPKIEKEVKKAVKDVKAIAQAQKDAEKDKKEKSYFEKLADEKEASRPHKIVLSGTSFVSAAAYIRGGRLWLVIDKPDYYVMPQIRGPQISSFGEFQRMDVTEGTVFYVDLPKGKKNYALGEGGGLNWNVIISETRPKTKRQWPKREVQSDLLRGGKSLQWLLENTKRVIKFKDPFLGDDVHVALVDQSNIYAGEYKSYVDFTLLDSIIGMAIVPKVDDLDVSYDQEAVTITRPDGLALMSSSDVRVYELGEQDKVEGVDENAEGDDHNAKIVGRIFRFDQWRLGGKEALRTNQEVMMQGIAERNKEGRAQDLVSLAKLEISNARGAEAVGYLKLAGEEFRPFRDSPEYLALLGAAYALNHQYDVAFRVFMVPQLNDYEEIRYWRAYALAELDDWSQAGDVVPNNTRFLRSYPKELRLPLSIVLAEVFLRRGDVERAGEVLQIIESEVDTLSPTYKAGLVYLKGELMRQKGNDEGALDEWYALQKHPDDFYRTRARLAVTNLRYELKEITVDKAIDDLERLRFSWRGDDLETTVNFRLGRLYIENKAYIKGLSVLRKAVSLSKGTGMGKQMAAYMRKQYRDLFLGDKSKQLTPLELAMIYEEFSELTPAGKEADLLLQSLAERLVDVDLLDRAIKILKDQVGNRTTGVEQIKLALRLTGIQLINNNNKDALRTLKIAERSINQVPILESVPYRREMNLLRARGLSRDGRSRDALVLLNNMKQDDDVVRLKADIAWRDGHWNDAAEALEELVTRYNLNKNSKVSEEQANMILNWAVALSLSGNRHVIANVRSQYSTQMQGTPKGRLFEVVTRPRQNAILADRDTIGQIVSEVDIFSDFLDSYRAPSGNKQ